MTNLCVKAKDVSEAHKLPSKWIACLIFSTKYASQNNFPLEL